MILQRILSRLLLYLVLTVIIEAVAGYVLGAKKRYDQLVVLLSNLITNPLMNALLTVIAFYSSARMYYIALVLFEIIVVITEGIIYEKHLKLKMRPFLFSLLLNLSSLILGYVIIRIAG